VRHQEEESLLVESKQFHSSSTLHQPKLLQLCFGSGHGTEEHEEASGCAAVCGNLRYHCTMIDRSVQSIASYLKKNNKIDILLMSKTGAGFLDKKKKKKKKQNEKITPSANRTRQ
jgi:hypothetical protein